MNSVEGEHSKVFVVALTKRSERKKKPKKRNDASKHVTVHKNASNSRKKVDGFCRTQSVSSERNASNTYANHAPLIHQCIFKW